jgi:hypothetical protein
VRSGRAATRGRRRPGDDDGRAVVVQIRHSRPAAPIVSPAGGRHAQIPSSSTFWSSAGERHPIPLDGAGDPTASPVTSAA